MLYHVESEKFNTAILLGWPAITFHLTLRPMVNPWTAFPLAGSSSQHLSLRPATFPATSFPFPVEPYVILNMWSVNANNIQDRPGVWEDIWRAIKDKPLHEFQTWVSEMGTSEDALSILRLIRYESQKNPSTIENDQFLSSAVDDMIISPKRTKAIIDYQDVYTTWSPGYLNWMQGIVDRRIMLPLDKFQQWLDNIVGLDGGRLFLSNLNIFCEKYKERYNSPYYQQRMELISKRFLSSPPVSKLSSSNLASSSNQFAPRASSSQPNLPVAYDNTHHAFSRDDIQRIQQSRLNLPPVAVDSHGFSEDDIQRALQESQQDNRDSSKVKSFFEDLKGVNFDDKRVNKWISDQWVWIEKLSRKSFQEWLDQMMITEEGKIFILRLEDYVKDISTPDFDKLSINIQELSQAYDALRTSIPEGLEILVGGVAKDLSKQTQQRQPPFEAVWEQIKDPKIDRDVARIAYDIVFNG